MSDASLMTGFFSLSPAPLCIGNDKGLWVRVNPAFVLLLGYDENELLSVPITSFVHPDHRSQTRERLSEVFNGSGVSFESRFIKKDGSDCWLLWTAHVREGLVYAVAKDVTERKQEERVQEAYARRMTERLEMVVKSFPVLIWEWKAGSRDVFCFGAVFKSAMGYHSSQDVLDVAVWKDSIHPEDVVGVLTRWRTAIREKRTVLETTYRLKKKSDGYLHVRNRIHLSRNEQGRVVRATGTMEDITAKEWVKRQLKHADQKVRAMLSSSGDGVYILDVNFNIILINEAARAFSRVIAGVEGYVGMNAFELVPSAYRPLISRLHSRVLDGKRQEAELLLGEEGDKRWYFVQGFSIKDEKAGTIGICIICKDIHSQKQAAAELEQVRKEKEQVQFRLQSILDHTPLIVFIKDLEGRYLLVNKSFCETFQLTEERIIENGDFSVDTHSMLERFRQVDLQVISTLQNVETEVTVKTDKGERNLLIVKFPLFDKNHTLYGIGGIGTDITERTEYQRKLIEAKQKAEAAEMLQEQFLANMSHEIRTPMNGIIGMANILMDSHLSEEQQELMRVLKQSSDNLLLLINDILDLSKIKAGKLTIEQVDFSLDEVLENTLAPFTIKAKEKGLALELHNETPASLYISGDRLRLHQVLTNLISNALKFTNKGAISVAVHPLSLADEEVHLQFSVSDTGIGIAADKLETIFDSFVQADTGISRKFGGTGLGLSITRRLIELQGGQIEVSSDPGVGTTFTFSLKFQRSAEGKPYEGAEEEIVTDYSGLPGKRVLVVEDNEVNLKVVTIMLEKAGILVEAAQNGRVAVELLEAGNRFDLVIMDLQMPEMNGFQTAAYIRKKLALDTPIIAMTASALRNEKMKCFGLGMNEYLPKPFVPAVLFRHLSRLMLGSTENATADEKIPDQKDSSYNLSYLYEMDDPHYFCEVLQLFLTSMPVMLEEVKSAVLYENWEQVYQKAHRMKSSLGLLQMNKMLQLVSDVELKAKEKTGIDSLPEAVNAIIDKFAILQPLIEAELKQAQEQMSTITHYEN